MKPPGNVRWEESSVLIGGSHREAFVVKSEDTLLARNFVVDNWHWAYSHRAALFICYPPKTLGEPVGFTEDGRPCYRQISPPAEIWFLPGTLFGDVWAFARSKGFAGSKAAPAVLPHLTSPDTRRITAIQQGSRLTGTSVTNVAGDLLVNDS